MQSLYETENNTIQPEKSNFTSVSSETAQSQCRAYIVMLKKSIKELHAMLKIRLRVEFPDSIQVLNQLNEKLLNFSEIGNEVENLYQDLLEQSKIYKDGLVKAQKYDKLMIRLQEIEQTYKQQNEELVLKTKQLEEESQEKQQKIQQISQELLQKMEESSNYKIKCESIENDLKLKVSEINRVSIERDNIKRQSQNLNSLLKQVNEEKEVKTQKMQSMVEEKIEDLKDELNRVKDHYQKKIFEKDNMIEKLERELQLTKKELELNAEFTFLQSSMSNSAFQSYNTQNMFNNQSNQKHLVNNYPSNAPLPKSSQPSSTKNQKDDVVQNKNKVKDQIQQLGNSKRNEKFNIEDELDEDIHQYSPNQVQMVSKIEQSEPTDRQRHSQSISKLESPFTRNSTKDDTGVRTSRESKKINVSSIQNQQFDQDEEDDTLAQLSDNSDELTDRKYNNKFVKQQKINPNNSFKKQDMDSSKNKLNTSQSSQNEKFQGVGTKQYDDFEMEDIDDDYVEDEEQYHKNPNKSVQFDEEEEEDHRINNQSSIQQPPQKQQNQNKYNDMSSNEEEDEDHSISGELNVNDDEFSDNDSIDQEVKRRLQIKQQEKQKQKDLEKLKQNVVHNRSFENSSNNQSNYSSYQPQRNSSQNIHQFKNREEISQKQQQSQQPQNQKLNNLITQNKNQSFDRQSYDQDSDESLERNAEQIRALQKKRNQEKFEENKKKLMMSKKREQEEINSSEEDEN